MKSISLFSSSGIGDLGLMNNEIETIINAELLEARAKLFKQNHPQSKGFVGDIWERKEEIVEYYKEKYPNENLYLVMATPPCQGMSQNGAGKMLNLYRKGVRPKLDERNRLIVPTMDVITALRPQWIILENVPQMQNTVILDEQERLVNIMDYIEERLGEDYVGGCQVVNMADYGVAQNRKRLITVYTRNQNGKDYYTKHGTFIPKPTHAEQPNLFEKPWITVRDAIGHLPPLDSVAGKEKADNFNEYHYVSIMDPKKYEWIKHTPEGETAFNNQCINPECLYQENQRHGAKIDKVDGINKFNKDTPLYCEKCNSLLPRPYTIDNKTGEKRIMKGYTSAYKRMLWDAPASTITMNFQYVSSDNKAHPEQNRVLSIYEAMILQTISDYPYVFKIEEKNVPVGLIRDSIGESVPPKFIDILAKHIKSIS